MSNPMVRELGYKLHYISRYGLFALNKLLEPYGVAHGQFPVLRFLWIEEGQTQAELCKKVQVEQPTLANTLKRMERDELIKRVPDENDRRQTRIYLTDHTKGLMPTLLSITDQINMTMLQSLTDKEINQFVPLLDKIYTNLAGSDPADSRSTS